MPRVGGARTAEALVAVAVAVATIACVDTAEVAVAGTGRCVHGHSPVWDAALQRLHWVDIGGRRVLSYDPAARTHQELDMLEPGKRGVLRRLPGHLAQCAWEGEQAHETSHDRDRKQIRHALGSRTVYAILREGRVVGSSEKGGDENPVERSE